MRHYTWQLTAFNLFDWISNEIRGKENKNALNYTKLSMRVLEYIFSPNGLYLYCF